MTRKSDHQQLKCYSIREVISQHLKRGEPTLPYLLFAHAFTGCDTTLGIYRFGKTSIFKRLENSERLRNIADIVYKDGQTSQIIGTAAISFFEALHSSSRSNVDPLVLPPSPRAAVYHGLRIYHQIKVWLLLMNTDCDLMNWGWEIKNGYFHLS